MPRNQIEPHKGDKRYVRRKRGKFTKSQDGVGRSLATDRRQHAKRVVKSAKATEETGNGNHDPVPKRTLADGARTFVSRQKLTQCGHQAALEKSLLWLEAV